MLRTKKTMTFHSVHYEDRVLRVYVLDTMEAESMYCLCFTPVALWQVVDEIYSHYDPSEVRDESGVLQKISQSAYLNYVRLHHINVPYDFDPLVQYRVWTVDEVIEVITSKDPEITLVPNHSLQGRRP